MLITFILDNIYKLTFLSSYGRVKISIESIYNYTLDPHNIESFYYHPKTVIHVEMSIYASHRFHIDSAGCARGSVWVTVYFLIG
jgi:hypothetical protein